MNSSIFASAKTISSENAHNYNVALLSVGHLLNDFYCNFLPILIPLLIVDMGLSLTLSGVLVMSMAFAANVLQPVFGYYMDRYNFSRLLLIVLPFGAVFICMTSFTDSFPALLFYVTMSGLAVSVFHPMATAMVSKAANPKTLGVSLSIFIGGGNIGFAIAPIILVYFIQYFSMKMLPVLIVPTVILSLMYYQSGLYKVRTAANAGKHSKKMLKLRDLAKNLTLLKLNAAMAIRTWTHGAITTFLPTLLITNGYDRTVSGWLLTVFLISAAIGGFFGGYLNDRVGQKKVILSSMLLAVFPALYFLLADDMSIVSFTMLALCGFFIQAAHPCSVIWCQKFLPDNPNLASGMMLGLSFGLGGIGAALTAVAAEYIGLKTALAATALTLMLGALIIYFTPEEPCKEV